MLQKKKHLLLVIASLAGFLTCFTGGLVLTSCKGGTCAGQTDPLSDKDSDCVADSGDNCPLEYNPSQFDGDEDGLGFACDSDDTDDTIGTTELIKSEVLPFVRETPYVFPGEETTVIGLQSFDDPACDYFLVGCGGVFLGFLVDDEWLDQTVFNPLSFYGRESTTCSAFNPEAPYPPNIWCLDERDQTHFVGYFSVNPPEGD